MKPITDNSRKTFSDLVASDSDIENLRKIANTPIAQISLDENPNLLVFPRDWNHYGDEIGESSILSMSEHEISTGNIMGFVGINDTQLDIKSRFAKDCSQDYFLHYMLQKVFSINLFDIQHTISKQPIFDFLLYLFPHFLKKALAQGIFKKYRHYEYNDANLRGPIDVNRHIRHNIPFRGTVAYSTREHSYDNEVTQLVRHTIEYIRAKEQGSAILNNDAETKTCVSQIVTATQSYNVRDRSKVIGQNLRPVRHPYYSAYTKLQKICLQILRHESIKYGQEKDKVYGVLFDGAWLWEEYLNTILKDIGFHHPENKKHKGGFRMFMTEADDETISKNSRRLYPDFYKDDFILDAKYKHLNNGVGREDLYQVVTYMYCRKANHGGYVYPDEGTNSYSKYQLEGYNGFIHLLPVSIPQNESNYNDFIQAMESSEKDLRKLIQDVK
ncbi:MAG: hypothetical protein E7070_09225 [Bacteroidales bacterium]|nr:hypothetical protein [Bacteroidales bacterium]